MLEYIQSPISLPMYGNTRDHIPGKPYGGLYVRLHGLHPK